LFAGNSLREALFLRGIDVSSVRVNTEPRTWGEKIATIPSPFIGQLLATVLKNSQNLYTEVLFKRSSNGTYDGSFARERMLLTGEPRIADDSFRFVDGCGLAPDDLVTARATVTLLRWMNDPLRRGFWWPTLAQPGAEGTLHHRLEELTDRMRGKTGSINGVNALSGILAMPDGHFRYFSIMVNHHLDDGDKAIAAIDAIVEEAAR
jgi:D-alanyl-D-alanine carboxypeptidase/D-alanyl-D-alanine-endopeptidase (penicillin-binding protein 4)